MRWFLSRNGAVFGPYEQNELASFVTAEDLVMREGGENWQPAAEDDYLAAIIREKSSSSTGDSEQPNKSGEIGIPNHDLEAAPPA